ncbi:hypothetical protein N9M41_05165 [Rhodopirellula sp.]|nr:hypothetical protein [Rhodopirellula sp.]
MNSYQGKVLKWAMGQVRLTHDEQMIWLVEIWRESRRAGESLGWRVAGRESRRAGESHGSRDTGIERRSDPKIDRSLLKPSTKAESTKRNA